VSQVDVVGTYFGRSSGVGFGVAVLLLLIGCASIGATAQSAHAEDSEFGPIVRAYLGYLDTEQNVVDDRVSRREVSPAYYRRNSNRINALRMMAIKIARDTDNDYLPELEAATVDEFKTIFDSPPRVTTLKTGEIVASTFRFLGTVRARELFYVFARLDPYERAELINGQRGTEVPPGTTKVPLNSSSVETRPRRARLP
jgi:hypothetical protein